MTTRVLVTGATGFVGSALCGMLGDSRYTVRAALRSDRPVPVAVAEKVVVGEIGATTDWTEALRGIDRVVHLAARAHVLGDAAANSARYFTTNVDGTAGLAEAAASAGVRRFVYVSSVKVNGEGGSVAAYTSGDAPHPKDAYGESKWQAEQRLAAIAAASSMETVIVRPPLVYGPGVRANFLRLMSWVDRQWPIPLGAVRNERSLVSVWNLCDLLLRVLEHADAAGNTWMVSDGRDLSTPELIRHIGIAMNKQARLVPVPVALLRAGAALSGRGAEVARLCGSLTVDIGPTMRALQWSPPMSLEQGLALTARWYLGRGGARDG